MKHILSLSLILAAASLSAQTFEWTTKEKSPAAHPKEVQLEAASLSQGNQAPQTGLAGVYTPDAQGTRTAYGETYNSQEMTGSHAALPLGTLLRVTNTENGKTVTVRVTDRGKECADCLITLSAVAAEELGINSPSPVSLERSGFSNWNPAPPAQENAAPVTYAAPVPKASPAPTTLEEVKSPAKPSVMTREVDPAPATYNRYPVIARPSGAVASTEQSVTPPSPTVPGRQEARGVSVTPASAAAPAAESEYSIQLAAYSNEAYALRRVDELKAQGVTDVFYRAVTKPDGEVINRVYTGNFTNANDAQSAARTIQGKFNLAGIVAKM